MTNTYYFTKDEVKEALVDFVAKKTDTYLDKEDFIIGFLDEKEQVVEVNLTNIFNMDL